MRIIRRGIRHQNDVPLPQQAHVRRDAGIVPAKFADDATHVGVATCRGIGVVVSWNFKHLASLHRNQRFNAVNSLHGHPAIRIVSPGLLLNPDEDRQENQGL